MVAQKIQKNLTFVTDAESKHVSKQRACYRCVHLG